MKNRSIDTAIMIMILCASVAATIDLVSPEDQNATNQTSIYFEYYVNLDNVTNCYLLLDQVLTNTSHNITDGFNILGAQPSLGNHSWLISCDAGNQTITSETRVLTIDTNQPTVLLLNPPNNSNFNSSHVDLTYVALDNQDDMLDCKIILDGTTTETQQSQNTQPTVASLELEEGIHTLRVECHDDAYNYASSEARTITVNTSHGPPQFYATLTSTNVAAGTSITLSLVSPEGTHLRAEACPQTQGFVECTQIIDSISTQATTLLQAPYTNKAGKYIIDTRFEYLGYTSTVRLNYSVNTDIQLTVREVKNARRNEPITLDADASGGIGKLEYLWKLSNGTLIDKDKTTVLYSNAGTYTNVITVNDTYNNVLSMNYTLEIEDSRTIRIYVTDSETGSAIPQATVDIDGTRRDTDGNGLAEMYVRAGIRELTVLATNHTIYNQDLNISTDQTLNIALEPLNTTPKIPIVTLLSPAEGATIQGTATDIYFRVEHARAANCSAYISETKDGFYIYLGSLTVDSNDQTDKGFSVIDLDQVTYYWKVECEDDLGKTGSSEIRTIKIGNQVSANSDIQSIASRAKEYELLLADFKNLDKDEMMAAQHLGVLQSIEKSVNELKNAVRDIDGLAYRTDLTDQQASQQIEAIEKLAQTTYLSTPVDIRISNVDNFVDYTSREDLAKLIEEQNEENSNMTDRQKERFIDWLEELQQEIVASSKTMNVDVNFKDGSEKSYTLIIREVKTFNITADSNLVEIIPKQFTENAELIKSSFKFAIIKKDPIISFPLDGDVVLSYYVEGTATKEQIRGIRTIITGDYEEIVSEITGFATIKVPEGMWFIPILIILGAIAMLGYRYDGLSLLRYGAYAMQKSGKLHYVNVILNEIDDNLGSGNFEKASELYDEARRAYDELPTMAKNDAYEHIIMAQQRIQDHAMDLQKQDLINTISDMVTDIESNIAQGQIVQAIEDYNAISHAYEQLSEQEKAILYPALIELSNKINRGKR